jgi:hypothetical protein
MIAILSRNFVGSCLFAATCICVPAGAFVHWLLSQNPDTQLGVKIA